MTFEQTLAGSPSPRQETASRPTRRPVILMTPDLSDGDGLPTEREYVVRANYAAAITEAGGLPLILPYDGETLAAALSLADGIVITGARPGADVAPERRRFERMVVETALAAGKPLLGICHGMQLIGECLGGEFVTQMPGTAVSHMPRDTAGALAHEIVVEPAGMLAPLAGPGLPRVNSLHRHVLAGQGRFQVAARAPDGVIEAFEGLTAGFCLGIQWHPEYRLTALDQRIWKAFVDRCAGQLSVSVSAGVRAETEIELAPTVAEAQ